MEIVFLLFLMAALSWADPETCEKLEKCGECISNPDCLWCLDSDTTKKHCLPRDGSNKQNCQNIMDPVGNVNILSDQNINSNEGENLVLIQPQKVSIKLRPGDPKPQTVYFEAMQSSEYPLDTYFLLDLSWSMKETRKNFANQAGKIISDLTKVTEDLNVGFGSFIDKHLPPFASYFDEFNCNKDNTECSQPYSFYHQTNLGKISGEDFKKDILSAFLGGNVDGPEGGLDALMQAMVCKERIGWRDKSRKIILFATDEDFHFAMDGKLIGILEPNDGHCHLDGIMGKPGYYTKSKELDYPSISHINAIAQNQSFVIIFAVIPRYLDIYKRMAENMTGSYVETLEQDSEGITQIIKDKYDDLLTSIEIGSSNVPERLSVALFSDCSGSGSMQEGASCKNLKKGQKVKFKAEIKAHRCLNSSSTFTISPAGLNQSLVIEVETICSCDCENPDNPGFEYNSPKCNGEGDLQCGICSCRPGFTGKSCECNENDQQTSEVESCGGFGLATCSGQGQCNCGKCICNIGYYGEKCQCKVDSCPRNEDDQMCSGHGSCECNKCKCFDRWSGEDCSCSEDTSECKSPFNAKLCSGFGSCECNKCLCVFSSDLGQFGGYFCEKNRNEKIPCKILEDCAECQAFKTGKLKDQCNECIFDLSELNMTQTESSNTSCQAINENGCTYIYSIDTEPRSIYLHVIDGERQVCPDGTKILIASILTPVLLIFALAIAAVMAYIYFINRKYRKEYEEFVKRTKNQMNSVSNQTPLYISPISTYKNPLYEKDS